MANGTMGAIDTQKRTCQVMFIAKDKLKNDDDKGKCYHYHELHFCMHKTAVK